MLKAQTLSPIARWSPLPGPQTRAYLSSADELFYGGAGGGGKTDLLLGLAGTAHRKSLILRRVFPELRDMIERSREIFNAKAESRLKDSYNESLHIWRLVDNRMIEFGSVQHEKDREAYRGRPHDFYGWDEVTAFGEKTFRFVNGWNRSTTPGQRCRIVATFNPPTTPEAQWIINYLAPWLDEKHKNPAEPGELRWYAVLDSQDVECKDGAPFQHMDKRRGKVETIYPKSRTFIPARLEDNPILEAMGYRATLQAHPEPLRSQMLYGDMQIGMTEDAWQVIPTEWIRLAQARWEKTPRPAGLMSALGVDVARGGECQTVLARRYRNWFDALQKFPGTSTPDGQSVVARIRLAAPGRATVNIDVIGYGSSPYDIAKAQGIPIRPMNGAEASDATDRAGQQHFVNKRAEWYWRLREDLDPASGMDICLPPDRELLADLCAPRWKPTVRGIQIEAKEDIAKRIPGRSPDCGDAVVYAHATDGLLGEAVTGSARPAGVQAVGYSGTRYTGGF